MWYDKSQERVVDAMLEISRKYQDGEISADEYAERLQKLHKKLKWKQRRMKVLYGVAGILVVSIFVVVLV